MNSTEERQMLRHLDRIATAFERFNRKYDQVHPEVTLIQETRKKESGEKESPKNIIDRVFDEAFADIDKMMEDLKK